MSKITSCRLCGADDLAEIVSLGTQALTGVFPRSREQDVPRAPLDLVRCASRHGCGLVQLRHSFDPGIMYGSGYGYRSGLNPTMVSHLRGRVNKILDVADLSPGDIVLDVGSNDGTALGFFPEWVRRVGIDPTARTFREFYQPSVEVIEDFFSPDRIRELIGEREVSAITSFSMFYDIEDPLGFASDISGLLKEGGLWVFEQSYLPSMLANTSYDTICHEHLEYYSLSSLLWLMPRVGLRIVDIEFTPVNGGSFCVVARKENRADNVLETSLQPIFDREIAMGLGTSQPYDDFRSRVMRHRSDLLATLAHLKVAGRRVGGLGASTKGNVILQYCNLTTDNVETIGEINADKVGAFTPGTLIPITHEDNVLSGQFDVLLVLPWHFSETFRSKKVSARVDLLFPLPEISLHPLDRESDGD